MITWRVIERLHLIDMMTGIFYRVRGKNTGATQEIDVCRRRADY